MSDDTIVICEDSGACVRLSHHAKIRMNSRGIDEKDIIETVLKGRETKQTKGVAVIEYDNIRIIINNHTSVIITLERTYSRHSSNYKKQSRKITFKNKKQKHRKV